MATSPKERFDAAVKVIHGLPKNGPFQPSYEMMLNFYGYYKQATEGPCTKPKPWAWDVVAKKKWDSWTKLGDMDREQAMTSYVEELKKIVETMPQDQVVRDFMVKLGDFYEVVDEKMPTSQDVALEGGQENLDLDHSMRVDIAHQLEENDPEVESPEDLRSEELEERLRRNEALADQILQLTDESSPLLTNGMEAESTNSGQGDSESEEEFCDTSDHPSQDSESPPREIEELMSGETVSGQMSTPIKSNKTGNHVHFNNSMTVHSGHQITQQVMSPISKSNLNTNEQLNIPASFPFHGVNSNTRQLSESMLTHGASPDSQNVSMESVPDGNYQDRSTSSLEDSSSGQAENIGDRDHFKTAGSKVQGRPLLRNHSQQTGTGTRTGLFMAQGGAGEPIPRASSSGRRGEDKPQSGKEGNDQLAVTLMRLQQDMNRVLARLDSVESAVLQNRSQGDQKVQGSIWNSKWWPFPSLTGRTFFFVFVWPFVVHWLLTRMFRRRRQNR
ncbi:acyl-CoA-binding domain-containing protein 5-like isoform X2 [Pecten maximus]|uniref:acyl-CoA-binding domain-containing protein 5-like isoform X2 n=1 Tax=Pecten maximus TaxID=6579 RepID=UPI0014588AC4|nr:acyl-CoA-binding domain-containing protein 5-like isoform X2 [Pecten maximus]